eukprot:CAMPEP_0184244478 /NCGR_PEP_ID=MMETSP0977-20130417/903_1 /TAXON_ID=483370 /ORGANISM="non described non described, Strain CCMP2097" /LENGTH=103 /DNA_ID=CAMNT_0026549765 /DNA_START=189 /DNA_END=495 /DNA_ORIENTATION=-
MRASGAKAALAPVAVRREADLDDDFEIKAAAADHALHRRNAGDGLDLGQVRVDERLQRLQRRALAGRAREFAAPFTGNGVEAHSRVAERNRRHGNRSRYDTGA